MNAFPHIKEQFLVGYQVPILQNYEPFDNLDSSFAVLEQLCQQQEFNIWANQMKCSFSQNKINEEEFRWTFPKKASLIDEKVSLWTTGFILSLNK